VAVSAWVQAPSSYLDVSATYNAKDRSVCVNVLNRSKSQDVSTRIENQEGMLAKTVEVWQMNHPDLKATHTFGDDKKVVPTTSQFTAALERNGFVYTFPAHSLTILKLRLQ
jgi:alpha-L-arabinofuranosidase